MKKKILSMILAVLTLACVLVACAEDTNKNNPAQTTNGNTDSGDGSQSQGTDETTELLTPDLPEVTFDGHNFRFYSWNIDGWRTWDDIYVEDPSADTISSAVYNRNAKIEDQYDITISCTYEYYTKYAYMIQQNHLAGDDYADVLISHGHVIPALYTQNAFYNLQDIPYIDFEMPWWDQNATESLTLKGFLPFGVSDLTLLDKGATYCIYYNLDLAKDLTIDENLYQTVLDGEWTLEKLKTLGALGSKDMDGDTEISKIGTDRYGIIGNDSAVTAFFNGSGCRYVTIDSATGYPQLSFSNEYTYTVMQYYLEEILFDSNLYCNTSWVSGYTETDSLAKLFAADLGLFYVRTIAEGNKLRNMESEYAILPIPKYSTDQKEYACPVSIFDNNLISVPFHAPDVERTGIILEALSAESYYSVIPEFYDTVLDQKIARDDESKEMLNIIFDSRIYDLGEFYCLANFSDWVRGVTGQAAAAGMATIEKTSNMASFYETYRTQLEAALQGLIDVVDQWNEATA